MSCLADVSGYKGDLDAAVAATQDAMRAGADIIYQAALREGCFIGHADFLRRVANITRLQIRKLNEHGVATLESLARFSENEHVPKMVPEILLIFLPLVV